jgi:hypothetical protein
MGRFINHNSFALLAAILWLTAAGIILRKASNQRGWLILAAVTALFVAGFFALRPAPSGDGEAAEINAQIGGGKPVLLEVRSPN